MEPLKKMRKAVEAPSGDIIDKMDRISYLPDDVLHHILSFLDVFDAVGAGLLSKRWECLCSSLHFLDIDIPKILNQKNLELSVGLCRKFRFFISWVLTSRSATNIIRLRLLCNVRDAGIFSGEQVFRWMCAAAKRNVQELIIVCDPSDVFHMPFSLVGGQSLQVLELNLSGKALQLPNYPGFLHLRSLCLTNIKLTDEDLTRTFFSGCPVLNKLVLSICTFEDINVLHISSVSIEHLFFEDGYENGGYGMIDLKISCPNLLAFKYGAPVPRRYIFEGVSSLETMHIHPWICETVPVKEIASCIYRVLKMEHKIVELKLGFFIIMGLCEMGDEFKFTCCSFHGLKVLNVWLTLWESYMRFLSVLLEHCPNLESLTIYPSEKVEDRIMPEMEDFSKITCLRSTVKTIQLIDFKGEDDEIDLARNLLKAGLVLKKFVLYWSADGLMDEDIVKMVLSFDRSSASVEIVFIEPHLSMDFDGWLSIIQRLFFEHGLDEGGYSKIDLKISCPKLLAFKYGAPAPREYIFEGMSSLNIHPCEYEGDSPEALAAGVYGALKMAHKIVELKLGLDINLKFGDHILSEIEDLSEITCLRSTVNSVKLMNFKGEEDEIELVRTLLDCGLVLKKFVVCWSRDLVMDDGVVDMISSFPKSSASVEVVFVDPDSSISFEGWQSSM